jgi:hypothetical protein
MAGELVRQEKAETTQSVQLTHSREETREEQDREVVPLALVHRWGRFLDDDGLLACKYKVFIFYV